jgi:hypothetical protein
MFLGNSTGPLSGGVVAAAFGSRWVFPDNGRRPVGELAVGILPRARIRDRND